MQWIVTFSNVCLFKYYCSMISHLKGSKVGFDWGQCHLGSHAITLILLMAD